MPTKAPAKNAPPLTIYVTRAQLALLKKFDYPGSQGVLASAQDTEDGIELAGTRYEIESLAGWVAGEANHARGERRRETLHDLADEIESALDRAGR